MKSNKSSEDDSSGDDDFMCDEQDLFRERELVLKLKILDGYTFRGCKV